MAKRQRDNVVNIKGLAHLCYVALDDTEDNHAFQGHVVDTTSNLCYGFMATRRLLQFNRTHKLTLFW